MMKYSILVKAAATSDFNPYVAPAITGATTLGGVKLFYDVNRLNKDFLAWDKATDIDRMNIGRHAPNAIGQLSVPNRINSAEASRILDNYIREARNLTGQRNRILGVRPGNFVRSFLGAQVLRNRWKDGKGLNFKTLMDPGKAPDYLQGPVHHYNMYTSPKTHINDLRFHHVFEPLIKTDAQGGFFKNLKVPEGTDNYIGHVLRKYRKAFGAEAADEMAKSVLNYSGLHETSGILANLIGDQKGILGNVRAYSNTVPRQLLRSVLKFRNPLLAAGAGATALSALIGARQYKQAGYSEGGTGSLAGGMLGGGSVLGASAARDIFRPNRNIAVTFGQMHKDFNSIDVGSGHRNPANALIDLLRKEQAGSKDLKRFNLSKIIRNEAGILPHHKIQPSYNTVVDTGLGLFEPDSKEMNRGLHQHGDGFFKHAPKVDVRSRVGFMTDATHPTTPAMSWTTVNGLRPGRDHFLMYGPKTRQIRELENKGINVFRTNNTLTPLISDSAFNAATANTSREEVLSDLIKFYGDGKGKDLNLRNALAGIKPSDRLITISGSGRGDLVAQRALEISKALQNRNIDNVKILAQLADSANTESIAKAIPGMAHVIPVGRMPVTSFNGLQRIADVHSVGTGTSSLMENLLQKNKLLVSPKQWGMRWEENPYKGELWWRSLQNFPDHHPMAIDSFNDGNRYFASKLPGGLKLVDDPNKIIDMALDDKLLSRAKVDSAARAAEVVKDLRLGQQNAVSKIFDIAKNNVRHQRVKGGLKGIAALGLLSGGAGLLNSILQKEPPSKWDQFLKRTGLDAWT
jgi:hypothetical protein